MNSFNYYIRRNQMISTINCRNRFWESWESVAWSAWAAKAKVAGSYSVVSTFFFVTFLTAAAA